MKKFILICAAALMLSTSAASAADTNTVTAITAGTSRSDIHTAIGSPENSTAYGERETYSLRDGETAVFRYTGDTLDMGYILLN